MVSTPYLFKDIVIKGIWRVTQHAFLDVVGANGIVDVCTFHHMLL